MAFESIFKIIFELKVIFDVIVRRLTRPIMQISKLNMHQFKWHELHKSNHLIRKVKLHLCDGDKNSFEKLHRMNNF